MSVTIDPGEAQEAMRAYTQKKGVLAFGVVDVDLVEKIAPPGYGPRDIFPRAKSVISIGVGGGTQGAWAADARTLAYIGDTETAAYKAAYGLAFLKKNIRNERYFVLQTWILKKAPGRRCKVLNYMLNWPGSAPGPWPAIFCFIRNSE